MKKMNMVMLDEEAHIPSQTQMFYLVRNLIQKCNNLEHKVEKLEKYANITKKQINAIEWLNTNITLSTNYKCWVDSIEIDEDKLFSILKNGYIEGIYSVIESYLSLSDVINHPIKCFKQNPNVFFMYNDDKWTHMTLSNFKYLGNKMSSKLIKAFNIWKSNNIDKINTCDRMYDTYVDYMRIILGENKTVEQIIQKLKPKLYSYLKCDLKNIVKYEFTF